MTSHDTGTEPADLPDENAIESRWRSRRYVTSGYRNVFHRAFLYGMGLRPADMKNPFVGVAVAHNEAVPGQASVRALGDLAKQGLQGAGFTERGFVVPESFQNRANAIAARELVADSTELVVRGHWYDALVGVGASPSACFGLAQAILRLRIPGVVLIPDARVAVDAPLAAAATVLEILGLGRVVALDDRRDVARASEALSQAVHTAPSDHDDVDRLRTEMASHLTEHAVSAPLVAHVAALAHEVGIGDLGHLAGGAIRRVVADIDGTRVHGLSAAAAQGTWEVAASVEDGHVLTDPEDRTVLLIPADQPTPVVSRSCPVLLVPTHAELTAVTVGTRVRVAFAETSDPSTTFPTNRVAGCEHPGLVESELNYDRL
ncbi:Dihydroxy-acid dehydratase (plasmid) [Rhodococcus ruber]|uniref:dihydroxy-acid dehydratase domain-containing protein n=1 Tax=Rhodococcus ruber TaxID=1830 RepID=UPI00315C87BC